MSLKIDWMDGLDVEALARDIEPEPVDPEDAYRLSRDFIESEFYKRLFLPMLQYEVRNAMLCEFDQIDPSLKAQLCEYRKAWWKLVNRYLNVWLNPPNPD